MRLLYVSAAHVKSIQPAAIGYEERGVKNIGPPSTYANAHNPLPDRLHPYCVRRLRRVPDRILLLHQRKDL